jgi:hypothetical protein
MKRYDARHIRKAETAQLILLYYLYAQIKEMGVDLA